MDSRRVNQYENPTDFTIFELALDAASDIAGLTIAIQSLSQKIVEVRVDIYNSFIPRWAEEGVFELFEALGKKRTLKLEFYGLRIFPYQVPISMVEKTLSRATQLEELSLVGIKVSGNSEDFDRFSEALKHHPSLKSFCLDNCRLENETEGPLLDNAVVSVLPVISTLEKVIIRAMEPSVWATLSSDSIELLCSSPTLKELELFVFSDAHCCDPVLMGMAKALIQSKDKTKLTHLSISGSLGGLKGSKAISEMLHSNKILRSLELHLRGRSDDDEAGIIELSKSLACNETLTSFQLHGRPDPSGSPDVRKAFVQMLQTNCSLVDSVHVFHPGFLRPENEFYLKLNRRGRGHLLKGDNVTKQEWVGALVNVSEDLPCLYYFLSMNPLLCTLSSSVAANDDASSDIVNLTSINKDTLGKRTADKLEGHNLEHKRLRVLENDALKSSLVEQTRPDPVRLSVAPPIV